VSTGPFRTVNSRVGLLMATWNQSDTLSKTLGSLLNQTHDLFSLTLVTDSKDLKTAEVLSNFEDPRIKVVSTQQQQGFISALNLAMQHSKPASFYAVVYATYFYGPHFLHKLLMPLLRNSGAAGVFCASHQGPPGSLHPYFSEPGYRYTELLSRNILGPGVLFRTDTFKQAGGLFVSEKQGIWETWKRMALHKPFISTSDILLRMLRPSTYERPAENFQLQPEKDILPVLKLRCLILERNSIDPEFMRLLKDAGHEILVAPPKEGTADLIILGSLLQLDQACRLAEQLFLPVLFVTDQDSALAQIYYQQRPLMRGFSFATSSKEIIQRLAQIDQQEPVVYFKAMRTLDFNRQLSRVPLLLSRFRTSIVVRCYVNPLYLQNTLDWLMRLSHPDDWGDLLILCPEAPPTTIAWLKTQPFTWYAPQSTEYFPELLHLLRQMRSSLVLGIDAGVLIPPEWYLKTLPYLSNPRVGMVSSLLHNSEIPDQHLPFKLHSLQQFEQHWKHYKDKVPHIRSESLPLLSDSLFLMRKHVLERVLIAGPTVLPLAYPACISHLLGQLEYPRLMTRDSMAFNLLS
jgi:hypothetical protein